MPTVILDRIPLPNLRLYTTISVLLVSCCLYYAIVTTNDPDWRQQNNMPLVKPDGENDEVIISGTVDIAEQVVRSLQTSSNEEPSKLMDADVNIDSNEVGGPSIGLPALEEAVEVDGATTDGVTDDRGLTDQMRDVMSFMCQEPFCIWVSHHHYSYTPQRIIAHLHKPLEVQFGPACRRSQFGGWAFLLCNHYIVAQVTFVLRLTKSESYNLKQEGC